MFINYYHIGESEAEEKDLPEKIHPQIEKSSSEQVCLNNFRCVPDSRHREEGKSSRELLEKVRVNAAFCRKVWVSINSCPQNFVYPPAWKRAQNEEKLYKSVENPQN